MSWAPRWLLAVLLLAGCGDDSAPPTNCEPLEQELCYLGPEGTEGVGACRAGVRTCSADGSSYSTCQSQILPSAEDCGTALDDDCDGEVNEACECVPGTFRKCYSGPASSLGVGACEGGTQWCREDGLGFDACQGEVVPSAEDCTNATDDDCDGQVNQAEVCVCSAGDVVACYSGPQGTEGVGACVAGTQACLPEGGAFGPCEFDIGPSEEDCATPFDEDCDGLSNEADAGCSCSSGETQACYSGPEATAGVGVCSFGQQSCAASGDGFGACVGDVVPSAENCATPLDDDCDGEINEEDAGCECTPQTSELCYTGPDFTLNVGTCRAGMRTCNATGQWGPCVDEVLPLDDDCLTPLDENCDGAVNEPNSGCFCSLEYELSLESENCVLDYGESAFRKPLIALPRELGADAQGNAYALMVREEEELYPDFEPVPSPLIPSALFSRYLPNGDFFWGVEVTGSLLPEAGFSQTYNLHVSPNGDFALTAPTEAGATSAFGGATWSWPQSAYRILYSVDAYGFPYFAASVPRHSVAETQTALHSIAMTEQGSVFYANGTALAHLLKYDFFGSLEWDLDLELDLDDVAIAGTDNDGVILAFTTNVLIDWGIDPLPLLPGSSSDLILARYDSAGTLVWVVRPLPSARVLEARIDNGVLAVVEPTRLLRFDTGDGSILSLDSLPGAELPASSFAVVGAEGVLHTRNGVSAVDFGLGELEPYGGQSTGLMFALREVGGTRWSRAPLANELVVAAAPGNVLLGAVRADEDIDLDGTLQPLMEPQHFLVRFAY